MSQLYSGPKDTQEYADLWTLGEMVDGQLDITYRSHGKQGVDYLLLNNDAIAHALSRIGAQVAYLRSGDRRVYDALATSKPPGQSDIVPSWALEEARTHSTALWKQEQRTTGKSSQQRSSQPGITPIPPEAPGGKGGAAPPKGPRKRGKFADGAPGAAAPP